MGDMNIHRRGGRQDPSSLRAGRASGRGFAVVAAAASLAFACLAGTPADGALPASYVGTVLLAPAAVRP